MRGANLSSAILVYAKMDRVDLSGATIELSRLTVASHSGWKATSLTGMPASLSSDLAISGSELINRSPGAGSGIIISQGSNYVKGYLLVPGADLSGVDLSYANLSGLDLRGINFSGAHLDWVLFSGSNLAGANFSNASISNVTMDGANLVGAVLRNSWCGGMSTFIGANLTSADLTSVSCDGANFTGANFTAANLTSAWLSNTQFTNAVLTNSILENCYLGAVVWANVQSSGVSGVPQFLPTGVSIVGGVLRTT
jgi:uncharacterized protein YjbI with pentapeptide repeats